jgi:subtilisin family serine protease
LRGLLTAQGVEFQSYWAANMIIATGDLNLVNLLAARDDVARIDSNNAQNWIETPAIADFHSADVSTSPSTTEWGVNNVNAPAVWALGYTGQGIVVANQDTGMRWTHNAIKPKYRGWNGSSADHNYNWHDSIHSGGGVCGSNAQAPCDDNGHGTHTTGTTVGDDGSGNQVGVAPGAKWIGCRNMDQGNGTPATYTECFQFFIAPTDLSGNNPNPALRPDVMNNSWGCPTSEGCTTRAELETIVNNTVAAGIFVEVSAGNSGPGCSSVTDPPAIYDATFATGAIDSGNTLASFSSRGPSTFYSPNILKPQVSAPGVNVRSSYYSSDSSYGSLSGTSMAGPHVVGVVALLWSAHPELERDIDTTKTILQDTANPAVNVSAQTCGGIPSSQIPNNSFGYGRVDALAAVNSVPFTTPTPGPSATNTATNTAVPSNTAVSTNTATNTNTAVSTNTPTNTNTAVATGTAVATNTSVSTNTAVATDTAVATGTAVATDTAVSTPAVTETPTECVMTFTDVSTQDWFYDYVQWMYCNGVINGYNTSPPCTTGVPCFMPNNNGSRGQIAKMVVLGAGLPIDVSGGPAFEDVAPASTFYDYIETLSNAGAINGYPCGGPGEPCGPNNLPYFRPNATVTRGQFAKMDVLGFGMSINVTGGPHFEDVAVGSTFYDYIETLSNAGAINGYPCGGPGEPCGPGNLSYFRPGNNVTRAQISKIVYLSVP